MGDGLGCLFDVMNDEDCCNLPFWNTMWDLMRHPSSSLGIIFDKALETSSLPVKIHGVIPGSPADVMGNLKGDDEILTVDGCVVEAADVKHKLRGHDMIGTLCDVLIRRPGGETFEVQLQRTSATYIFSLGQVFDLLSAHELLLQSNANLQEQLGSLQAIRFQILDMERLRLTRESFLAAKIHGMQAKVFDGVIAALTALNVESRPTNVEVPENR